MKTDAEVIAEVTALYGLMADPQKEGQSAYSLALLAPDLASRLTAANQEIAILSETLIGIASANYREWGDGLNEPEEFVKWAKSRASHALSRIATEGK